ncbi:MAG: hypothetical protein NTZ65_00360 [Candidatus Berkelbacteria bacterium]|nr:hypothetical protein [Candidatus Berkelbacteria bacterium]
MPENDMELGSVPLKDMRTDEQREQERQAEAEKGEPTVAELVEICTGILDEDALAGFEGLELDDAIGYAYAALIEAGEDPDQFLLEKGFLEQ